MAWYKTGVMTCCLNLLFPPRCCVCEEVTPVKTAICPECLQSLPQELWGQERCAMCGKPNGSCVCREQHFHFSLCTSAFCYDHNTHALIEQLKTLPNSSVAGILAEMMAETLMKNYAADERIFDAVTEVPMTLTQIQKRGHNQAKTLAQKVAEKMHISYMVSPIDCAEDKKTQHTLAYHERFVNAQRSYRLRPAAFCSGRILLVDDVMTTGATLDRCAELLLRCGANEVVCLTAATTLRWQDNAQTVTN